MNYMYFTCGERYQIYALKKAGFLLSGIVKELGCHCLTILRKVSCNSELRGSRPQQENTRATRRKANKAR